MKNVLLTAMLATIGMLTAENTHAQAHLGVPIEWTPVLDVKKVPGGVQKGFEETLVSAGLFPLNKPKWIRQNGLLTVSFRASGEYGPGTVVLRFKPYGGLVLFSYDADNPPVIDWFD